MMPQHFYKVRVFSLAYVANIQACMHTSTQTNTQERVILETGAQDGNNASLYQIEMSEQRLKAARKTVH